MIQSNYSIFTLKCLEILSANPDAENDIGFIQAVFRLLKSLALQNMLSVENIIIHTEFITNIHKYLLNDILYQYISSILFLKNK